MIIDIPNSNLELRSMSDLDYKNFVEHVIEADELYLQYGYEKTEWLLDAIQEMYSGVNYYSVFDGDKDEMVGYVGIASQNNNLEFYIFEEHRNKGYGTLAVRCFVYACFGGLITGETIKEVMGETLCENQAAIRLLEKSGFKKKATGIRGVFNQDTSDISGILGLQVYELVA